MPSCFIARTKLGRQNGKTGGGSLWLQVGDTAYEFDGFNSDLDYDDLIRIAESLT